MSTLERSKRECAQAAAERGCHIFPVVPNMKEPLVKFKEAATRDSAQIAAWWDQYPEANIGIYCGRFGADQALAVIDVDRKNGKDGTVEIRRRVACGQEFPDTYTVKTPTGGFHLYYVVPRPLRGGTDKLGSGVDVKSHGGYVLGEGSTIDGRAYERAVE